MIPVIRFDHISMAHTDHKAQYKKLAQLFGFGFLSEFGGSDGWEFSGSLGSIIGTNVHFEIIEPSHPGSFVKAFLDKQGPGLHHVAVEIPNIEETVAELERLELIPFGGITDDGFWRFTFIHPRQSGGILWQLFQPKPDPAPSSAREEDKTDPTPGVAKIETLDHVALFTDSAEQQADWHESVLGFKREKSWEDKEQGYRCTVMSVPGGDIGIELIEPTQPESENQPFIKSMRAGMHHIGCKVPDLSASVASLQAEGIEPYGGIVETEWRNYTFIHPRDSGGVLFQIFEEPTGNG